VGAIAGAVSSWRSNKAPVASNHGQPDVLAVGEILRPHGIRGELRMRVLTDNPDQLSKLDTVYLADSSANPELREFALTGLRFNKEYALLSLEGCRNRDDAERLRGFTVLISIDQAAPLGEGQYYLFQLIGMRVIAEQNDLGPIKDVLQTGANDVYIVDSDDYGEILIPAHDETILRIDFDAGIIHMALPEGLLPAR
jgi:16S rRNA processing protein RimM